MSYGPAWVDRHVTCHSFPLAVKRPVRTLSLYLLTGEDRAGCQFVYRAAEARNRTRQQWQLHSLIPSMAEPPLFRVAQGVARRRNRLPDPLRATAMSRYTFSMSIGAHTASQNALAFASGSAFPIGLLLLRLSCP